MLTQLPARTDNTVFVELADAQRIPYAEQQYTLARLLPQEIPDRPRPPADPLLHRQHADAVRQHVSLRQADAACRRSWTSSRELLTELFAAGPHKAVVFSQWETMLRQGGGGARPPEDRLHGHLARRRPGKDRRALLERFRDDPACKVFLSTDAGGTGLNLQSADTVINLEVPWNPAVLEQRIARVHRMGQHRPVQVFNLVTRGSIEERVLKTLEQKRSLFDGVFRRHERRGELRGTGTSRRFWKRCALVARRKPEPEPAAGRRRPTRGKWWCRAACNFWKRWRASVQSRQARQTARRSGPADDGREDGPAGAASCRCRRRSVLRRGAVALTAIVRALGKGEVKS